MCRILECQYNFYLAVRPARSQPQIWSELLTSSIFRSLSPAVWSKYAELTGTQPIPFLSPPRRTSYPTVPSWWRWTSGRPTWAPPGSGGGTSCPSPRWPWSPATWPATSASQTTWWRHSTSSSIGTSSREPTCSTATKHSRTKSKCSTDGVTWESSAIVLWQSGLKIWS